MRIAILLTSNDTSDFAKRFPDDGEKFASLLKPYRPDWQFTVVSVKDGEFPSSVDDYDGYVITGSPASVHDGHQWIDDLLDLILAVDAKKIPLVGACFGHQAVAVALGGTVGTNPQGWVVGTSATQFSKQYDWMAPASRDLTLYSAHKEQVLHLPAGAILTGHTPGCPNAAFVVGDHIMTTQYHPEMPQDFMLALIDEMGAALTPRQAAQAREQILAGEQGKEFGLWMIQFLESNQLVKTD